MRVLIATAALLFATPAFAGQVVVLKADPSDADGVVTLGDLFDGAGAAARTPVATRGGASVILDAGVVKAVAYRAGLDWANAQGLRRIVVRGPTAASSTGAVAARGNVEVLTYARSLTVGEIVQPADLVWGPAAAAPADAPSDADQVIGLAAKRPLRAGAAVSGRDVGQAQVIKSGELVTVIYEDGGISLALQGKAMSAAAIGEPLNVQNVQSKKVVQAVVSGPGQAVVGPAADALKAARSNRYALR